MSNNVRAGLGALLVLVGLVWTLQGLGVIQSRSAMTGVTLWAIIGPVVAVVGVYLLATAVRSRR